MDNYQVKIAVKSGSDAATAIKAVNDKHQLFTETVDTNHGLVLYSRDWQPWVCSGIVTNSTPDEIRDYMQVINDFYGDDLEYYAMCEDGGDDTRDGCIGNGVLCAMRCVEYLP